MRGLLLGFRGEVVNLMMAEGDLLEMRGYNPRMERSGRIPCFSCGN